MLNPRGKTSEARAAQRHSKKQEWKGVLPIVVLAFPLFLSVDLFNISTLLDDAINAWKILSTALVILLYLNRFIGRKPVSTHILPMTVIMAMLLFSTIANSGSLQRFAIVWGGFFAVGLLVESNIRERPLQLLLALKIVLGSIALINFATVILAPDGLWSNEAEGFWLLGHRNNFGTPLIAALVLAGASDLIRRRRLTVSTFIIGAASIASVLLTWSASSVVAVILTAIAVVLAAFGRKGLKWFKPFPLLITYAIIDIGIVVFHIQDLASDFITNVLERSTDLTGRTQIWDLVFDMIRKSPLIGNGVQLSENNGLTKYNVNFVHAHNGELDILMQGGLFVFIPFVFMMIITARSATKSYDFLPVQILFIGLILVMFRGITGLFFSSYAMLLVFLILNADIIADEALRRDPAVALMSRRERRRLFGNRPPKLR